MMGYGGGTESPKQIAQLAKGGFGMMIGPSTPASDELPYAIDNGAFPAWRKKLPWPEEAFLKLLDKVEDFSRKPDFGCCPDIVAAGLKSLEFSLRWIEQLPKSYPWYLAVQDGMTEDPVRAALPKFAGIFVGGTDDFKLSSCPTWVKVAREQGKRVHVGRVNTLLRAFTVAKLFKVDSFDGNSWNRTWSKTQTKAGEKYYFGRGRAGRRGVKDTAKPADVEACGQGFLDLWGLGGK